MMTIEISNTSSATDDEAKDKYNKKVPLLHPRIVHFVLPIICLGMYMYTLMNDPMKQ